MIGNVSFIHAEKLRVRPAPSGPVSPLEEPAPSGSASPSEWSDAAADQEGSAAKEQEGPEASAGLVPATRWRRIRQRLESVYCRILDNISFALEPISF